jgi:hypothetical protein
VEDLLVQGAAEIAKKIGESKDSIQALVDAGELKAWKQGPGKGKWRALPEDLQDFVRRQRDKHIKRVEQ